MTQRDEWMIEHEGRDTEGKRRKGFAARNG
jgi:hypothetical protein